MKKSLEITNFVESNDSESQKVLGQQFSSERA